MYQLVIGIQCISIFALLVECWVVFKNWKGELHSYLLLACGATLINNIGYLTELMSKTEEAYMVGLRMSYLGRIWIAFALFLFITKLTGFRIPRIIEAVLALVSIGIYVIVFTTEKTGLYYVSTQFDLIGSFPVFHHEDGVVHSIYTALIAIYLLVGMILLVISFIREQDNTSRKRLLMVIFAVLIQGAFVLIEMLKLLPIENEYDITMLSFPIAAVFMFIAIFKYELLDTKNLAREFVIDELAEGIIAVDAKGRISYYNKTARILFPKLLTDPANIMDMIYKAIETDEPLRLNERLYSPESNPLIHKGVNVGTIYALVDDTEHYRYMEELSEQKQIADDANKAKSTFLANMSHEIRTPINAVLGMDEMILRESNEQPIRSYAADIQTAGRTLLSLINDILDFSKIEEGKMEIIPTQYELATVVNDLVNMIRDRAANKGLKLTVNVDENIPHLLYGDEIRIKQVALNLLTNAVKYTKQGEVKLGMTYSQAADDRIKLKVTVTDTGIGMKEEDMERLFSPFARIEEKRNRTIEGTGLGMSIVKQLLDLMDSKLEVKSVYGEGSEFSFEIEQTVVDQSPIGDITDRLYSSASREEYRELFVAPDAHILIVDDTEMNLTVMKNLLKRTELQLDTVMTGREAIELKKSGDYDVVFIDHMMPDMDGIETLHQMKETAASQSTYIALTANAVSGAREMYLSEGFDDYLSKPVNGKELEKMLKKYLPAEKILPPRENDDRAKGETLQVGDAGATDNGAGTEDIPEWLYEIGELDVSAGLENCGNAEGYMSVLKVFHSTALEKAMEIGRLYKDGDIRNYTIKVHALKSSARIIGASALSDMAKDLEEAGNANDMDRINANTHDLIFAYRELDKKLERLDEPAQDKKPLTDEMRNDAYTAISEIAQCEDHGMLEAVLEDIRSYSLSDEDEKVISRIEELYMQPDWEGIRQAVREVMG